MKAKKRIISIIMALSCASALASINVTAEPDSINVPIEMNYTYFESVNNAQEMVEPRDNDFPSKTWNLSEDGEYTIDGYAAGSATLFTSYKFKSSSGEITFKINNDGENKTFTVYYYKNGTSEFHRKEAFSLAPGKSDSKTIKVKSSDTIFLGFSAPCNVSGTVTE